MLQDRLPEMVDLALRWNCAKNRWVNHTYSTFIAILCHKKDRDKATRLILGLHNGKQNMDFHKSIDWDNLSPEWNTYWTNIENWVVWFQKYFWRVEEAWTWRYEKNMDDDSIIQVIEPVLGNHELAVKFHKFLKLRKTNKLNIWCIFRHS